MVVLYTLANRHFSKQLRKCTPSGVADDLQDGSGPAAWKS